MVRSAPSRSSGEGEGSGWPRRKHLVAIWRDRQLTDLPAAAPRPGERPFWTDPMRPDPLQVPVSAIMTSPAIAAEESTTITALCRIMWNLRIHRVPILHKGKVTGLVSSMDLCRAILAGQIKL
jgi:CBS-domain-containing membrane protein